MVTLLAGWMYVAIVLDHAHLACPIVLAWSTPRFRAHMLQAGPVKFVLLPAACIMIPLAIGVGSWSTHEQAFKLLAAAYVTLNTYHFASQNYGVCALSGGTARQRYTAFALTALPMALLPIWWHGWLWLALVDLSLSVMHWAQDIRLSGFVASRQWLFTCGVLGLGLAGFAFATVEPRSSGHCGPMLACTAVWSIPALLGLRYGLGFWHFLMSRWVWSSEGRALLA